MRGKKTTTQYAEEKTWVFSFDLEEESEDECLTKRGREFHIYIYIRVSDMHRLMPVGLFMLLAMNDFLPGCLFAVVVN